MNAAQLIFEIENGNGRTGAAMATKNAAQKALHAIFSCVSRSIQNLGQAYCHKGELEYCESELTIAQSLIAGDPDVAIALRIAKRQQQAAGDYKWPAQQG